MKLNSILFMAIVLATSGCGDDEEASNDAPEPTGFLITFANTTEPGALMTTGDPQDVLFAPGVWAVHTEQGRLFASGDDALNKGMEKLAEEGRARPLLAETRENAAIASSGPFAVLDEDDYSESPIGPGQSITVRFQAAPGDRVSFASMYIQSNDIFMGTPDTGIELFDAEGNPKVGDISAQVFLWDAGTEKNEEPGIGPNQAPRQSEEGAGDAENGTVMVLENSVDIDGFSYPSLLDTLNVTLTLQ